MYVMAHVACEESDRRLASLFIRVEVACFGGEAQVSPDLGCQVRMPVNFRGGSPPSNAEPIAEQRKIIVLARGAGQPAQWTIKFNQPEKSRQPSL